MKKIAIIPTLLTLGNAVCGFAAIACAGKIGQIGSTAETDMVNFALSGWLIIAAMIFDALDGYVARLAKTASNFGVQLDSLCDAVSFGAAPALLLLRLGPGWDMEHFHYALSVVATLYMVCAILRLARFNLETTPDAASHKRFRGLPSPAAAGCLACLAILRKDLIEIWPTLDPIWVRGMIQVWATFGGLLVALLMVSRVPYPHLTNQILRGRRRFSYLVQVIVAVFGIVLLRELALILVFWGYALGVLGWYAWVRSWHPKPLPVPASGPDGALPREPAVREP